MKRGQGAFEYLMSYGWAILIVIMTGIALWNLGVFETRTPKPPTGYGPIGLASWAFSNSSGDQNATFTIAVMNRGGTVLLVNLTGTTNSRDNNGAFRITGPACKKAIAIAGLVTDDLGTPAPLFETDRILLRNSKMIMAPGKQYVIQGVLLDKIATGQPEEGCNSLPSQRYTYTVEFLDSKDYNGVNFPSGETVEGKRTPAAQGQDYDFEYEP